MRNWSKEGGLMKCAHRYFVIKQALDHHITNHERAKQLGISTPLHPPQKQSQKLGPKTLIYANCARKPLMPFLKSS